ncbi:MAG: 8-oxo-dGTP diphosphatase [Patescibacteria group bacterium]
MEKGEEFLLKDKKVLLAMKKRGFGEGLWNGVGGKVKDGEGVLSAAKREALEEIGVSIVSASQKALIHFYFPDDPKKKDWNQDVHVFLVNRWRGMPKETEEMRPRWFDYAKLPFRKMWTDDVYWLLLVLSGKKIEAWFAFDDNNQVIGVKVKNVGKGRKVPK